MRLIPIKLPSNRLHSYLQQGLNPLVEHGWVIGRDQVLLRAGSIGDGPSSGTPRWTNLLLASRDPVATDTVAAEIIGLEPRNVPTTRIASEAGLGIGWTEMIEVVGKPLEEARISGFQLTSNRKIEMVPGFVYRLFTPYIWVRPGVDRQLCTKCATCVDSCPNGALRIDGDKIPVLNRELCISCWCCHELCPSRAIFVNKSWLAKKFLR